MLPSIIVETFFCCISRIICHVWLHFGRINFQKQQKQPAKYYHLIIAPLTCFHYDGFGLKETSTSQNIADVANAFDFYICSISPFSIFSSRPDKDRTGINKKKNLKKNLYGPFLWIGFNCLKATTTSRRQFTFYHSVPRNSWYSFYRPQKDERLSWPWSHPMVLNTGTPGLVIQRLNH